jgi:hypothetical protein
MQANILSDEEIRDYVIGLCEEGKARSSLSPELGRLLLDLAFDCFSTRDEDKHTDNINMFDVHPDTAALVPG